MNQKRVLAIIKSIKRLAVQYYAETGKPLGVTGEIAEVEAARILDLKLYPARNTAFDAVRTLPNRKIEKIQIKGRWSQTPERNGQRLGRIRGIKAIDSVVLVLLNEKFDVQEIYEAKREAVEAALQAQANNSRGLPVRRFISIAKKHPV